MADRVGRLWPSRRALRYHRPVRVRSIILALAMAAPGPAPAQAGGPQVLLARGHWAALRHGSQCEAAARPLPPAAGRAPEARAGFVFAQRGSRRGEFHARLSRWVRSGSSVIVTIGKRPFLLVASGERAWSRGPLQEAAMIDAARAAASMRIEARDSAGRRFADRYLLAGAPSAIDAAAAGCAGRS